MVNQNIENLMRQVQADPDNLALQTEFLKARGRVEGNAVFLELLEDRLKWNELSESLQDLAIDAVGDRLGPDYQWLETKSYSLSVYKHETRGGEEPTHRIASFTHLKSGLILNLIPGGKYLMGADTSNLVENLPGHPVTITPFLIGRFPVRQSCWDKIGGEDQRSQRGEDLPIHCASWNDCQNWLKKAGGGLRLPSESEWEYACRSGTTTTYFWEDCRHRDDRFEIDSSYAWYDKDRIEEFLPLQPVTIHFDEKKWNAFGLVDVIGNIMEYCQDNYLPDFESGPFDSQPRVNGDTQRVCRGGCAASLVEEIRTSHCRLQTRGQDDREEPYVGFRIARSLP